MLLDPANLSTDEAVIAAEQEVTAIDIRTSAYTVTTAEHYADGAEDLKQVKTAQKRLEDLRTSFVKPLNESVKRINEFFRGPAERLAQAEGRIKRGLLAFSQEQDRIRREEQRKADEAAERERKRLADQAAKAAAAGKAEKAQAIEERAAAVVAPVISREPPKIAGISMRETWRFEIADAAAVPREYLVVDESKIRKIVGALKGDTSIPGVRVWREDTMAAGSA